MVEIKYCGLTRAQDAAEAAACGATFAGAIFARGPRLLDANRAVEVFAPLAGTPVRRVGVFGGQPPEEIARVADATALHVIQLHDGATLDALLFLRQRFAGVIWTVLAVSGADLGMHDGSISGRVDGVVLDTAVAGRSGGTGVAFDWAAAAPAVAQLRARTRVVLAGGLRPSNVRQALDVLPVDVVDVSSGVESAPGIKDPELMRAFAHAVRSREEK